MHYQEFNNFSIVIHSMLGLCLNLTNFFALFDDQKCQINLSGTVISHIFLKRDQSENTLRDCASFRISIAPSEIIFTPLCCFYLVRRQDR